MLRKAGIVLAVALVGGLFAGAGSAFATHTFPDVPDDVYYTEPVEWLAEAGLTTGYGSTGEFKPDINVNRAQMATFLKRFNDYREDDEHWASVGAGGAVARSSDSVESATNAAAGVYEVTLDRDVRACGYFVTVGTTDDSVPTPGIGHAARGSSNDSVLVVTTDADGTPTNRAFFLNVVC